jgi:hypothetical protein
VFTEVGSTRQVSEFVIVAVPLVVRPPVPVIVAKTPVAFWATVRVDGLAVGAVGGVITGVKVEVAVSPPVEVTL